MALVRFKTGDTSFLNDEPRSGDRFSPKLGPIPGRMNHVMEILGTTPYSEVVYSVLQEMPAVSDYYVAITREDDLSDSLAVICGDQSRVLRR